MEEVPTVNVCTTNAAGLVRISALFDERTALDNVGKIITVGGWSRSVRKHGAKFCFVALNDGTTTKPLQVVVDGSMPNYDAVIKCGVACSFKFVGELVESPAKGQFVELRCADAESHKVIIYGTSDASVYPLAKKAHGRQFLRDIAHLRPRTNVIGAASRVRSQMSMAVHRFFQDRGYQYVHTPLITGADCEGAGVMFQVSTILGDRATDIPVTPDGMINYKKDFFEKKTFLTVSGQLAVENYCCSLSDVYSFGPTFRAENSHTSRHLAEFWMIEPEIAFADIHDLMAMAETCIKYLVKWALRNCTDDLDWLNEEVDNELLARLEKVVAEPFEQITYTEAVDIVTKSGHTFEVMPKWGDDLGSEHERYLTEVHFKKGIIVRDYPRAIKSFYMRTNDHDERTVAAMDVLLPKLGEIIGGSQREERLDRLDAMIEEKGLSMEPYWWYRDLRRYGTIPHSGFGLGFERLVMLVTGLDNIRDVIPFPRYPGHAEF